MNAWIIFSIGFRLFVSWQEVIKRYLKTSRNRAVTRARQKFYKKNRALRGKEKKQKTFYCNKMNNKKKKNWDFYEMRVENRRRNFHYRLKKYFKEPPCTFLERNEYSPFNINQRYVLTCVFLPIIQRDATRFVAITLIVLSSTNAVPISDKIKFIQAAEVVYTKSFS